MTRALPVLFGTVSGPLRRGAGRRLAALSGAIGFLTRLPIGRTPEAWRAFAGWAAAFPLAGYLIGAALALVVAVPAPAGTVAVLFVVAVYAVTGINHLDGVADVGDAAVVHGDAARRREVLADTTVGVGGTAAVAVVVVGLALAALSLSAVPPAVAAGVVVAAEVGAKLGMAAIACLNAAVHEGLGEQFTEGNRPRSLVVPAVIALPVTTVTWPHPAAAVALAGALLATAAALAWARRRLGGVNGDVFGVTNELARLAGLHAGLVAWTALPAATGAPVPVVVP